MSRKIPTDTDIPVRAVRSLLRRSVANISRKVSNIGFLLFGLPPVPALGADGFPFSLFYYAVSAEGRGVVVEVLLNVLDNAVAQVYYLVGNVGHAAFVGHDDYCHAVVVQLAQ